MNKPNVNVTPLIDVLLVLLIIFMVVAPLKPSSFKTRVPAEQQVIGPVKPHPDTLVVALANDGTLRLNNEGGLGAVHDTSALIERLRTVFDQRAANGNLSTNFADDPLRPVNDRIERTVFIKAARSTSYGSIIRVIDAVKIAGAYPISLQIDSLE